MTGASLGQMQEIANEIGPVLAERAASVDECKSDPGESYDIVRHSGLLGALVPAEYGGAGLDFSEYCQLLEQLAFFDGATALGFNMHNVAIGSLCEAESSRLSPRAKAFREWVFDEILTHRRLFASGTSETGTGVKLRGIETSYEQHDHGYILNGHKSFVSLADVADYYVITARARDASTDDEVSHFVISRSDEGVSFEQPWPGFAMNGTATAGMHIRNVLLAPERLFMGIEGMSLFKVIREPHWMVAGYTSAYLGVTQALFQFAGDWARSRCGDAAGADVIERIGEMNAQMHSARALIAYAAQLIVHQRGTLAANSAIHAAKYLMGRIGPAIAADVVQLCGSSALNRSSIAERLIREAQFCAVMPAKPRDCLEYLGKSALGYNMFDAGTMAW